MHEDGVAAPGQLVGPAHAAVVQVAMALHHRVEIIAHLGNLAGAEILVAPMIVQRKHAGERPLRSPRLEKPSLRRGTVRKLPGKMLDVQAVVLELMLDLGRRDTSGIRPEQAVADACPCDRPPGVEVGESRIPERESRGTLPHERSRPGAVRPDHVRFHRRIDPHALSKSVPRDEKPFALIFPCPGGALS